MEGPAEKASAADKASTASYLRTKRLDEKVDMPKRKKPKSRHDAWENLGRQMESGKVSSGRYRS